MSDLYLKNRSLDVVAIGSPMIDVVARVDEEILERLGLTKGAMTLTDADRMQAIYASMPPSIEISGGSAANTIAGVASLGGKAGFIGKVAMDAMGDFFTHDMTAMGVEFEAALAPARSGHTARCLVLVTDDAERTMATHLGVANTFAPEDVDRSLLSRTKLTYLEGYLFDLPPAKTAMQQALLITKEAGGEVALTLSDSFCVDRHREDFLELIHSGVDYVLANEHEAMSLFETDSLEQAVKEFDQLDAVSAITRGANDSVLVDIDGPVDIPIWPVEHVVDTNGAGDLFAAGFLYGVTHGFGYRQSARLASLCAAEVITHPGGRPATNLRQLAAENDLL